MIVRGAAQGQSVTVYSEFQRIDPFGKVVAVDRATRPREILSPELPRNAHTVFHVAVTGPPEMNYFLFAGSNPAHVLETTLYKENFVETQQGWIPDGLTAFRPPYFGAIPDAAAGIAGQTTRCYLLDIWVPSAARVQRVRVEVSLKVGIWFVAPMEVRIVEARVPPHAGNSAMVRRALPDVADRADTPAVECLATYVLGGEQTWDGGMRNLRDVVRRSAEQDLAMARAEGARARLPLWLRAAEEITQPGWRGAEWYLGLRDWVLRNWSR